MGTTTLKLDWNTAVIAAVASALQDEIEESEGPARKLAGTVAGRAIERYRMHLRIALDSIEGYRGMAAAAAEPDEDRAQQMADAVVLRQAAAVLLRRLPHSQDARETAGRLDSLAAATAP
jgi:hypothetical protein